MTKKTTDYYDICVKQQKFIAKKEKAPDKLSDSSALNFAWRPGQEKNSILIEDCYIDGRGASEGLKLSFLEPDYLDSQLNYRFVLTSMYITPLYTVVTKIASI